MKLSAIFLVITVCMFSFGVFIPAYGGEQLLNLPDDRPSFPVPADIVWPETVGEPHICLWYGDKFAAVSITIDDNIVPQHAWWMQMANTYNFTPTWFIIVGSVENETNPGFSGTWPDYASLSALGGDVQSHTMSHHSDDDVRTEAEVRYEYGQSQALIDANVPAPNKCLAVGYPYGRGNYDIAREYFIAGRGTVGTPNKPAKINWIKTCSASGRVDAAYVDSVLYGTSTISWLNSTQWKRGWLCTHFHTVQDTTDVESQLAYVDSLRQLIWWGSFVEVAKFGQERDSAEITMIENSGSKISFTLTDRMDDTIFNHPLSIKFRIPDAWNGNAAATQDGQPIGFELASNGQYEYVIVDAVPDSGIVEIIASISQPGDADGDGDVDITDFLILKANYGTSTGATSAQGDFDGDGDVDINDFLILKSNYGTV